MQNGSQQIIPQLPALSLSALKEHMERLDEPQFRAKQLLQWCNRGVLNPDEMGNIPASLREKLKQSMVCEPLELVQRQCSIDGTRKYLFRLTSGRQTGKMVETVFIPEEKRGTVCISSQIGCVLDCPFCYTGTQPFDGNLTTGEIIAQVLAVKSDLLADPASDELHSSVTHIVYMGMGEPLANEANVYESLSILMNPDGLKLSRRRITVSTSGLVPQIDRLGETSPVNLAISLHAAENSLRDELVPINRKHSLEALRACLDEYPLSNQRHITLEYVMLAGVNDREEDLKSLYNFVNRERERVNLISFNAYPSSPYTGSSKEHMNEFAKRLISKGIRATVRRSRGQDIMAACGQLKAESKQAE
ncbi:MAG: 23S rRNA (adenine(2503)-C(2))-methyltransferase RlmN [Mariprofundaceae bacterium]